MVPEGVPLVHYAFEWCLKGIMVNYGHRDTEAYETRPDQLFAMLITDLKVAMQLHKSHPGMTSPMLVCLEYYTSCAIHLPVRRAT